MDTGTMLSQLEQTTEIPSGSLHLVEMGDGSGTKTVTQETMVEETGKALKIGNMEELQTENKTSIVAAINEAAQSGGGGTSVDILDSQEEIEANTEAGKAAGALAVQEMFGALNDNLVSDIYIGDDGKIHKVQGGADSVLPFSSTKKFTLKVTAQGSGGSAVTATAILMDEKGKTVASISASAIGSDKTGQTAQKAGSL